MWLIYSSEDLVLCRSWGDQRSRIQKLWGVISNQKKEAGCQAFINGFLRGVWFTIPSPVELTVCVEAMKGRLQGMLEELGEHRTTNYTSKNNNPKSTEIYSCPTNRFMPCLVSINHHRQRRSWPLTLLFPQGKTSVTTAVGNGVTWISGAEVLVETCEAHFIFLFIWTLTAAEVIALLLFHDFKI